MRDGECWISFSPHAGRRRRRRMRGAFEDPSRGRSGLKAALPKPVGDFHVRAAEVLFAEHACGACKRSFSPHAGRRRQRRMRGAFEDPSRGRSGLKAALPKPVGDFHVRAAEVLFAEHAGGACKRSFSPHAGRRRQRRMRSAFEDPSRRHSGLKAALRKPVGDFHVRAAEVLFAEHAGGACKRSFSPHAGRRCRRRMRGAFEDPSRGRSGLKAALPKPVGDFHVRAAEVLFAEHAGGACKRSFSPHAGRRRQRRMRSAFEDPSRRHSGLKAALRKPVGDFHVRAAEVLFAEHAGGACKRSFSPHAGRRCRRRMRGAFEDPSRRRSGLKAALRKPVGDFHVRAAEVLFAEHAVGACKRSFSPHAGRRCRRRMRGAFLTNPAGSPALKAAMPSA